MKSKNKTLHSLKSFAKALPVRHRQGTNPPIFLFCTPRGGLTWLSEIIFAYPGMRCVSEPLNLRSPWVKEDLGVTSWSELWEKGFEQRLLPYFDSLVAGRNRRQDLTPFRSIRKYGWRFRTERTLFKVNNGGTRCLDAILDRYGGPIILLFRHPIPTTLSREVFPGLEALPASHFFTELPEEIRSLVDGVLAEGDHLKKGVLAWCFHNAPLVEKIGDPRFLCLSYEEMVIDPNPVLKRVAAFCNLHDESRLIRNARLPSVTTRKSDPEKPKILGWKDEDKRVRRLLGRWRESVPPEKALEIQPILDMFGIDLYGSDSLVPQQPFILRSEQLAPFDN